MEGGPPVFNADSTCPHLLRIPLAYFDFDYRTLTVSGRASHPVLLASVIPYAVLTLNVFLPLVWPPPLSLAATRGISVDFSSSAYLDVSVRRVPLLQLCIHHRITRYERVGFPHSDIFGSMHICCSPKLFAACHVLLRLPVPRHSPCTLFRLNFLWFSLHEFRKSVVFKLFL